MAGDIHPNPGPIAKYPCPVCARDVTSRGVSYRCTRCTGWVHAKCSGLLNAAQYRRNKDWTCDSCSASKTQQPTPPSPSPTPVPSAEQISDDTFNVLQFNANGIGNKQTELGVVLERNKVKVAVIQESKLSSKFKNPCIRNYTTVRKDRPHGHGGGLLVFIHESITFSKQPSSPEARSDPHLEELTIKADIGNTKLIISNIYIPPASSCSNGYQSSIEHLLTTSDTLILGDFNAHHPSWYSRTTDTRGKRMDDSINGSDYGILNWDSPTRVPQNTESSLPEVSLASTSLITSCSWQTLSTFSSDHLPIPIRLQMKTTSTSGLRRTYVNLKKADWDRYRQEVETALNMCSFPTYCQRDEKIFRTVLHKAASHHIPTGRHRLHEEPVPAEILDVMTRRDDLRKRDPTSPKLPRLNYDIHNRIFAHKRKKWRAFVETLDQKIDVTKLWRTIKGIDGRAKREAVHEAITFNGISFSSSKLLATKFNQQFNTSKLGRHTSSSETRLITRETKRKSLEMAQTFTMDLVMRAIKSCKNSKAFGPEKLSIFHLKNLGPRAIEYITALFNLSVTTCQIPAIWKSSLIIPIPKPGKDTSVGTSYQPISLLCPATKVLESLILPTINKYLQPAPDQHGFRPDHSTTSALLQMTTDIAMELCNSDRIICVAVDLSAAFDTVCHNNLPTTYT